MNGAQADVPGLPDQHPHGRERAATPRLCQPDPRERAPISTRRSPSRKEREKLGMLPPKWVFPQVIEQSQNLINGAPFDSGPDNDVFADFKTKVGKLNIPQATKDALIAEAGAALTRTMGPAYQRLIALLQDQQNARRHRRRHLALPQRRRAVSGAARLLHHHRPDARPGPRARPGPGRAHPRRDGGDQEQGRLQGHAAAILRPHPRRRAILLSQHAGG